jgi:2-methylcitrate dehydratase PrpD
MSPPAAPTLAQALAGLLARPVGEAERRRAALHLLDWLGCALAGSATETGRRIEALVSRCPFSTAGEGDPLALGALGSLLEMDDVHRGALLHPGPVVWPALLVMPQAPGVALLDAGVRGYEAMIRLGRALGPRHYAFFHNTSTCGGAGSAIAAASVLGLGPDDTAGALAHALSIAGGLWQCRHEPVATKHLHVAEAAARGVRAAGFARAGLGGPRTILEGPQGFLAALAPDSDAARIVADPDAPWLLHETSLKPWPACRHAHPAIDAALHVRRDLGGAEPAAIRVRTYADAVLFCDRSHPATDGEARFSLQHALAVVFFDGPPPLAAFEAAALPRYAALRARVAVEVDEVLTHAYPAHFGAEVEVTLSNGTRRTARVADAWGDPENPLAPEDIVAKFHRLADWAGVPRDRAEALRDIALALPRSPDTAPLHAAMRAALPAREDA